MNNEIIREYLLKHHIYCPKRIDIDDLNIHLEMGYFVLVNDGHFGISLYEFDPTAPSYFDRNQRALSDKDLPKCTNQYWVEDNTIASLLAIKINKFGK